MDLELQDKVVFVAGASRGIGYGIARTFLAEGAKVAITGRNAEALHSAAQTLSAGRGHVCAVAGDMTTTTDLTNALRRTEAVLGPTDIVVANVGGGGQAVSHDFSDAQWDEVIQSNLTGSVRLMREAIRGFLARPESQRAGCNIVAISSIAGVDAMGSIIAYGASKAALNHYVKNVAKEVGKHGIRINAVAPGNIRFPGG